VELSSFPDLGDNGTEFTANVLDAWAFERGIAVHFITPDRPVENSVIESFNGKLRDECLNVHWFESLEDARAKIEAWKDYNESRPHQALAELAPAEFASRIGNLERATRLQTAEN
jgi:putative transposase